MRISRHSVIYNELDRLILCDWLLITTFVTLLKN